MRRRKTRTREHVIADLGVNFVERQILLAGYAVDRVFMDYGLDLWITTFNDLGEVDNDQIGIQVKSTDRLALQTGSPTCSVRVETADVRHWMFESDLIMIVVYDAELDRAFWLDIQEYTNSSEFDEESATQTLRLPLANQLELSAVRQWRE